LGFLQPLLGFTQELHHRCIQKALKIVTGKNRQASNEGKCQVKASYASRAELLVSEKEDAHKWGDGRLDSSWQGQCLPACWLVEVVVKIVPEVTKLGVVIPGVHLAESYLRFKETCGQCRAA
jgi:hypothetical protein